MIGRHRRDAIIPVASSSRRPSCQSATAVWRPLTARSAVRSPESHRMLISTW